MEPLHVLDKAIIAFERVVREAECLAVEQADRQRVNLSRTRAVASIDDVLLKNRLDVGPGGIADAIAAQPADAVVKDGDLTNHEAIIDQELDAEADSAARHGQ